MRPLAPCWALEYKLPHLHTLGRIWGIVLWKNYKLVFFLRFSIYLFLERGEEREKERNGNIDVPEMYQSVASFMPSTGDLACNSGMCPDWESNQCPFTSQSTPARAKNSRLETDADIWGSSPKSQMVTNPPTVILVLGVCQSLSASHEHKSSKQVFSVSLLNKDNQRPEIEGNFDCNW